MDERVRLFGRLIDGLLSGRDLSREETRWLFEEVLAGTQPELHQGALLAALTAKGPTPQEIAGAWEAIYRRDTVKVRPRVPGPLMDNCGTGMDRFKTFNISTAAALVAAAAGVHLARHGARAITSRCGTVDLAEALGVDVECEAELVASSVENCGIGLFNGTSPRVHPALFRVLSRIRFGSVLNIAASLANPASPDHAARGVWSEAMVEPVAEAMREIGYQRALVFHGQDGRGQSAMDELSPVGRSLVAELREGEVRTFWIDPRELDIPPVAEEELRGSPDPHREAVELVRLLAGRRRGARREACCLNAASLLCLDGRSSDLAEGVRLAREILDGGGGLEVLRRWVRFQGTPGAERRLEVLWREARRG